MRIPRIKHLRRALTIIAGGLLAIGMGLACLRFSFGEPLMRLSYNLPFIFRSNIDTDKVILVYLDEQSAKQLHQPIDDVWNRTLHVPLLDRLTRDNARLVFYDVVFDQPAADPAADVAFADSIRRNGKVILGATLDKIERMGGV
ncbi:MAG TPA: CHASE2 domain-containing protein, partial [Chthoniobacterales bacterium]